MKEHKFNIGDAIVEKAYPDEIYHIYAIDDNSYKIKWVNDWGEINHVSIPFSDEHLYNKITK